MKKLLSVLCFAVALSTSFMASAQRVQVRLKPDESFKKYDVVATMERNLSYLLTEINTAYKADRMVNLAGINMNDFSRNTIKMIWKNAHFYCDDSYIDARLWNFANSYMVRQIPVIVTPDEEIFGNGSYQDVVVEFDAKGQIIDFRFGLEATVGESAEQGGDVVTDIERRNIILAYCERFRTAYCMKDIAFMNQIFSEDALIITGTVVTTRVNDRPVSSVRYKKQNKEQYLANLSRAFQRNKWIEVKFKEIGPESVTRSIKNPNMYGVRLTQEWYSSNYSDKGIVFLLWDFTDERAPVIHVRTWQPDNLGEEPFSISDFE